MSTLLLNGQSLAKSFGSRILFKDLSISIFKGDRIGLLGPNGAGKSTLLKILAGMEKEEIGTLSFKKGLKIGYIPQTCEYPDISVEEVLQRKLKEEGERDAYQDDMRIRTMLSKVGFEKNSVSAKNLSGGWKKRLSFAEGLILEPDLLLLDEPTNHLDLEGILFLEKLLQREASTYLVVSHDRAFLQNAANKIIEMDKSYPKGIFAIDGPYSFFLAKKEEFLAGQVEREHSLASKARKEKEWLSKSAEARRTKSKSRISDAHELLNELSLIQQRNRPKRVDLGFDATMRETRKLLVGKNLSKQAGERTLFRQLDLTLTPGTRIGLMGPNGSGKTTLLRMLAGEIAPDQGTIKMAEGLKIVYFDQHRRKLPDELTLKEALAPHGDYVTFRGQPVHVNGFCKRFLFSPDLLQLPIGKLSGGERARITIAHLMLQPADLLLLDEPTNDLDIPTLEALEESLVDFPGAVALITHDRCMLHRICNLFLPLGGEGKSEFFADYSQWESKMKQLPSDKKEKKEEVKTPLKKAKLTYAEKKEFEEIEGKILKLEEEVKKLNLLLQDEEIMQDAHRLQEVCKGVALAEAGIEKLYLRYEELDAKSKSAH